MMHRPRNASGPLRAVGVLVICGVLDACGGGGSKSQPATPTVAISGTVSGLTGTLVLQNNAVTRDVTANGSITIATDLSAGSTYAVTVVTQPTLQTCTVINGAGTATANVTNVTVQCTGAIPVLTVTPQSVKNLHLSWTAPTGVTAYKVFEDATGSSGFTQLGATLAATVTTFDYPVALHLRANARYKVQGCAGTVCVDSYPVSVANSLTGAIGYFKASNTETLDRFGSAVAVSADGTTLAIGAFMEDGAATSINGDQTSNAAPEAGAVYVFTRANGAWSQQAYLKPANTARDFTFGWALSMSSDGNTLVVTGSATAFVFARSGGSWTQETALQASNPNVQDFFGASVSLSAAGDMFVVGAPYEDSAATVVDGDQTSNAAVDSGAAYVYARNGTTWVQKAYLKAFNAEAGDEFGSSVTLSGDGNTLVVAAAKEDSAATGIDGNQASNGADGSGAAYVFVRTSSSWSQQAYIKSSNSESGDEFAIHLALSADGNMLAVGADAEDGVARGIDGDQSSNAAPAAGAVYVFARSGTTWSQQAYVKASDPAGTDLFGASLALSADGSVLAVGAPNEASESIGINGTQVAGGAARAGAVYVFMRSGTTWTQQAYVKASNTKADCGFGNRVALSADGGTLAVAAPGESSAGVGVNGDQSDTSALGAGAAYLY